MKTLTADEVIKKRYPFYDPNIGDKGIEINEEAVKELMEDYASQFRHEISEEEIERMALLKYAGGNHTIKGRHEDSLKREGFIAGAKALLPYTRKVEEVLINFLNWYEKLTPADKCSVWSNDHQHIGLFNMDSTHIVEKYLDKGITPPVNKKEETK